jgi:hypothetical protein
VVTCDGILTPTLSRASDLRKRGWDKLILRQVQSTFDAVVQSGNADVGFVEPIVELASLAARCYQSQAALP